MNEQMNILLEVLEEIKQQNRELKASVSNLVSQSIPTTTSSEEDGISLTDVARLIGQKIEIDGKFKSELTDVAIVLGKQQLRTRNPTPSRTRPPATATHRGANLALSSDPAITNKLPLTEEFHSQPLP